LANKLGLDLVFDYGGMESQKNYRIDILKRWLNALTLEL